MDRRGEMSDRDSDPAPFVRNSYIPETQQYLNYYGSQCYYEEPQALPQYYYFPQSQPQGPQVEGAGASMRNINSRNEVPVASESTAESYAGACGFQPGFYRSRKCPIRVKTTTKSTSVEQLG